MSAWFSPLIGTPLQSGSFRTTDQLLKPRFLSVQGSWTDQSDGNSLVPAVLDISDANYAKSSESPVSADTMRILLDAANDPGVGTGHILRYRIDKNLAGGDTIQLTIRLMQGATEIASWVHTSIPNGPSEHNQVLSSVQADAITDYGNLSIESEAIKV